MGSRGVRGSGCLSDMARVDIKSLLGASSVVTCVF